ncbi:hypothetical protein [Streptomyces kebangsaanensis]|uniref:hypothetical protein n=1 Tax=Streptomyces kebangsaanensis TaxID=864058 RepID=UPI00093E92AF|nr:hypothetical protein [Streptomyces kebangsaanensis]
MGSQDQHRPTRAERLAQRAAEIKRAAAGIDDPEASEDALREAARLRAEAREAAAQEQREKDAADADRIDAIRVARRDRRTPGGLPLPGTEDAA